MPRPLKPYKVDQVHHRTLGVTVDIMFDRDARVFFAKLELERVQAPSVSECKLLVKEMIVRTVKTVWEPVIDVDVDVFRESHEYVADGEQRARVGLQFVRKEVTKTMSGEYRERAHPLDVDLQHERRITTTYASDSRIPYSEATWDRLCQVAKTINEAARQLEEIASDPRKLLEFAAGSRPLLPAPVAAVTPIEQIVPRLNDGCLVIEANDAGEAEASPSPKKKTKRGRRSLPEQA